MNAAPFALLAYLVGVALGVVYGILSARKAGEPWDWTKFGLSMIASLIGALGEFAWAETSDSIIGTGALVGIIAQAVFAGFGTLWTVSKVTKFKTGG